MNAADSKACRRDMPFFHFDADSTTLSVLALIDSWGDPSV